jgi:acetylcholinesterase
MEQAYGHFGYVAPVSQTVRFAAAANAPIYLYHFTANWGIKGGGGADYGTHVPFATCSEGIRHDSDSVDEISSLMHAY